MPKRRGLFSYSPVQPWWQNSSETQRVSTANLVSGGSGTGRGYTTVILTRTQYTTVAWPTSDSSRSKSSVTSASSSSGVPSAGASSRVSTSSSVSSSSASSLSSSAPLLLLPTTLSTATTHSTSRSTTTIKTIISVTSTLTILEAPLPSVTTTSRATEDTTSIAQPSAASSSASSDNSDEGNSSMLISPEGSSRRSAAIAGGMTGGIAGIAMLGLLFLFLFRRRKKRTYEEKSNIVAEPRMSSSSQALPSNIAAARTTRHSNGSAAVLTPRPQHDHLPIIEHNLIHMNFDHWDRPFAHEDPQLRGDTASPLRLMNPDPSPTPPTAPSPNPGTAGPNNPHKFLQRQRSALAAALLSMKRSLSSQDVVPRNTSHESKVSSSSSQPTQAIQNKLTMPSELILAGAATPRPISTHSATSTQTIIRHHVPEDPFISSPIPPCLQPGPAPKRSDFLAPPPLLHTRFSPQQQQQQVSPLTRSNSDCSTDFDNLSPTRSDVSSLSVRSGPFDLATASVVGGESGRGEVVDRRQREQTPNWVVHVYPGT